MNCKKMNELYHHGILGMKWGVRRYQNEDGSYTAAGKVRYGRARESRFTDKQRRTIKIGMAAVTASLAIYGGYKLGRHIKITKEAKDAVNNAVKRTIDERTTQKIKQEYMFYKKLGLEPNVNEDEIRSDITRKVNEKAKEYAADLVKRTKRQRSQLAKTKVKRFFNSYERAFPLHEYDSLKEFRKNGQIIL